MTDLLVRDATEADLIAIADLLADDAIGETRERPGEHGVYARAFERMRTQPGNVCMLAVVGGSDEHRRQEQVVGCLQYTMIHGLSRAGASRAQIEGVRVRADHRGTGVGERLVLAAISRAREHGCSLVQLTTDRRRGEALRFYERLGFADSHHGMKLKIDRE